MQDDKNPPYSAQYNYMMIVGITEQVDTAGMLEASLIREFKIVREVFYFGP